MPVPDFCRKRIGQQHIQPARPLHGAGAVFGLGPGTEKDVGAHRAANGAAGILGYHQGMDRIVAFSRAGSAEQ